MSLVEGGIFGVTLAKTSQRAVIDTMEVNT